MDVADIPGLHVTIPSAPIFNGSNIVDPPEGLIASAIYGDNVVVL
jgi:hypothetical protein